MLVTGMTLAALCFPVAAGAQGLPPLPLPIPGGGDQPPPTPEPFRHNDFGGFRDVLPPGTNGLANGPDIAAFQADKNRRPPHSDDQLRMYGDLVFASPGLRGSDIGKYFKDASFGVPPGQAERTYSPRVDVTIVRDKGFGVPHVYGRTREGAMFGLGYIAAEDRLFFIDVLRHLGRAQLSSFAGGAPGNRAFDAEQWQVAPYTESDLQRQIDSFPRLGAEGRRLRDDLTHYLAGINAYIAEARLNPLKMPGEYAAIGQPQGPEEWKGTDVVATASLVGGIFGKGGGRELTYAKLLDTFERRFGGRRGRRLWRDFRSSEDPEAPTTVHRRRFTYQLVPRKARTGSVARPDKGSLTDAKVVRASTAQTAAVRGQGGVGGALDGMLAVPRSNSNALLVSGRESASGRPLAVFGPQVAYFNPEILMEQDVHAPTIDARGAAFPGVNLYVQLGRGRDYSWSATSAGQDLIDTFAVPLCNPGGGTVTKDATHYRFRGQCLPIERLTRQNSWKPNAADQTPPGSETLVTERTKMGLVLGRATIRRRPVVFTQLRTTYMHEVDSAPGFSDFNDPAKMRNPRAFQRAASRIGYSFNWFYLDDKNIAYFNSGNNPSRQRGLNPLLPVHSRFEWRNFDAENNIASYTPARTHPQVINQSYLTSWNNKQAKGFAASDTNTFSSLYRSQPLDDRVRRGIRGRRKMTLVRLIDAMEDAGTVDLRGNKVLPYALRVLGRQRDPALADAVTKLRAWQRAGAHRRDRDNNGTYEHSDAIRIMDAWWPKMVQAQFQPLLGPTLYKQLAGVIELDNSPNNHGDHLGSAYQTGWYGFAQKDLRAVLKRRVRGRFARIYCGRGRLTRCRAALASSLRAALKVPTSELYKDEQCEKAGRGGNQRCYDEVVFRPLGAITQPFIHWINRPSYQQVVEIQGHGPR